MKRANLIAIAAISTAYAGDWNFERQQAESERFERQQAEWQRQFDERARQMEEDRIQRQNERRFEDLQDEINRRFDFE